MLGLKKADVVLIILLASVAGTAIVSMPRLFGDNGQGRREAVVTVDRQEVFRREIPRDHQEQHQFTFTVKGQEYEGTLTLDRGEVFLHRLQRDIVPLPIHRDMGPISQTYQTIAAVPARLLVRIESLGEEALEFDVVAH